MPVLFKETVEVEVQLVYPDGDAHVAVDGGTPRWATVVGDTVRASLPTPTVSDTDVLAMKGRMEAVEHARAGLLDQGTGGLATVGRAET